MSIEIVTGSDVDARLADPGWRRSVEHLHAACAWATSMQSLPYIEAWYSSYRERYAPVLVLAQSPDGDVVGLLALAVEAATQRLVVAGDHMCEYGAWIAADEPAGNEFIAAALHQLEGRFPNAQLRFLYLAAGAPLDWLTDSRAWRSRCVLRREFRPLVRVADDAARQASLRKTGNRSRLNRLKTRGAVTLEHVTDPADFAAIFNTVHGFCDLRLSAVHRVTPAFDPCKRAFYTELFAANLLYVTLLRVGEEIASAHFDLYNRNSVVGGLSAVSPFFARSSPGKFHIAMLCEDLRRRGWPIYDLSPGGGYKNRHANTGDHVHVLTVFFRKRDRRVYSVMRRAAAVGRLALLPAGITRESIEKHVYEARHRLRLLTARTAARRVLSRVRGSVRRTDEMRVYAFDLGKVGQVPRRSLLNRDSIDDLLLYEPAEAWHLSVSAFHRVAAERLGNGMHVYTKVKSGQLVHWGWMIERQEVSLIEEIGKKFALPPHSAAIFDGYTHPRARGQGLHQASMCQILHDVQAIPETRELYVMVAAENAITRHTVEKMGFTFKTSVFRDGP